MVIKNKGQGAHARHAEFVSKTIMLLGKKQIVSEKDIGIDRQNMKTIITTLRKDYRIDVLTINRGRQTIGWMLASEVLK